MVNLGSLRCLQPGCSRDRPLLVQPGGLLICPICGAVLSVRAYFRSYAARTGRWVASGAVWLTLGAGRSGALRFALLATGAVFLLYALARALWQALAMRALAEDGGRPRAMSQERLLLHAVLHRPERDEPRQRYADLLVERGDPRGAFIKQQLRAAHLLRQQDIGGEYVGLLKKGARLLREHEPVWAAPLAGLVDGWEFQRGFPEIVMLGARRFLEGSAALYEAAPVLHLRLRGAKGLLGELRAAPALARLAALDLSGNDLGDADAAALAASGQLRGLRLLDLRGNGIGEAGLEALCASDRLPALRCLLFAGNAAPDPCDRPAPGGAALRDFTRSALGAALERRFGARAWLHFRPRHAALLPPPSALFLSGV